MANSTVIKDSDFQLISEFAQPDAKKRLSLGEALGDATAYNIYRNPLGQLVLDPVRAVPVSEMWLYENPQALASVKQGLRESAEGKSVERGSFAKYARIAMQRKLKFTPTADAQLTALENTPANAALLGQVRKALGYLEIDPHHPGLHTHEFTSLKGANGEKVFEAYAQNKTPGAYRIFWHYGPDEIKGKKRTAVITIVAITPHP